MNATGYFVSKDEAKWNPRLASPRLRLGKTAVSETQRRFLSAIHTVFRDLCGAKRSAFKDAFPVVHSPGKTDLDSKREFPLY